MSAVRAPTARWGRHWPTGMGMGGNPGCVTGGVGAGIGWTALAGMSGAATPGGGGVRSDGGGASFLQNVMWYSWMGW